MFIQDWLTLKTIKCPDVIVSNLQHWDKIVYKKNWQKYIWTYIWYDCTTDLQWEFLYKLTWSYLKKFYDLDKKANELFDVVKEELHLIFPMFKFIRAKMNFEWDIIYLYFYGETRVDFRNWLKDLKKMLWMNFFLYQVGARDRVRLHPKSCEVLGDCWHQLCCTKSLCKLDNIEIQAIGLQNLHVQWVDRQKWVCGKLKCCLKYEEDLYLSEIKKYPAVGTNIEFEWKKYTVLWINVLSWYIFLKDNDWYIQRVLVNEINKC